MLYSFILSVTLNPEVLRFLNKFITQKFSGGGPQINKRSLLSRLSLSLLPASFFLQFHNSKTCYNPILVGEYLALLSQQYGIWVILLNMNGPIHEGLNAVAWQWPSFPSPYSKQYSAQQSWHFSPRKQQKRNSKLSLKPSKH